MHIPLEGKNVLLTGSTRGIGRAIAEALGSSGARIGLHFNRSSQTADRLSSEFANGSSPLQADLSSPQSTLQLFRDAIETLGHIDVLINNAGISPYAPIDDPDDKWINDWNETVNVNLRASAILCREAVKHFRERGGGRIINIASRAAFRGDTQDYLAYAASKGGMVALTRSIARAFGKDHIVAFTIAPGFVRTDMAQPFIDQYGESYVVDDLALPDLTEPTDVAPLIALLASGLADHATGGTFDINAGSYVH